MRKQSGSRRITTVVLVAAVVVAVLYLGGQFLDSLVCTNVIVATTESPDHQLKAVLFHRECGAAVGENSQVSVLNSLLPLPQDSGNVFIEDAGHNDQVSLGVKLRWAEARKLVIAYDQASRIFKQGTRIYTIAVPPCVDISYERMSKQP